MRLTLKLKKISDEDGSGVFYRIPQVSYEYRGESSPIEEVFAIDGLTGDVILQKSLRYDQYRRIHWSFGNHMYVCIDICIIIKFPFDEMLSCFTFISKSLSLHA